MKRFARGALTLAFWLAVWTALALLVHRELLLPAPWVVVRRLCELAATGAFWRITAVSIGRVLLGVLGAVGYCGVAPFEHTSGISIRGKTQTSSLANKEVKVYLTRAAITAISWDPQMKAYYKRKTGEGKHKASVINAVRAKIIARCFAVIKRKTPFVTLRA